tara:strand:- start:1184 stop:1561 length:378 start_codon:yes stop_codon:yes gene_type:complete
MKDNERTQRTPQEIIAEVEARLERLHTRAATKEAKSNPEVAALYDQRDAIQKDIRDAKKILGNGPQSGEARIAKHNVWIDRINAEMDLATTALDSSEAALAEIDSSIKEKVLALTKTSQEKSSEA